ncbi:MAG: ATP-binding protein [Clostridiales bacterium]|nr:ATP-binding protein [Clostridiales bacterium]
MNNGFVSPERVRRSISDILALLGSFIALSITLILLFCTLSPTGSTIHTSGYATAILMIHLFLEFLMMFLTLIAVCLFIFITFFVEESGWIYLGIAFCFCYNMFYQYLNIPQGAVLQESYPWLFASYHGSVLMFLLLIYAARQMKKYWKVFLIGILFLNLGLFIVYLVPFFKDPLPSLQNHLAITKFSIYIAIFLFFLLFTHLEEHDGNLFFLKVLRYSAFFLIFFIIGFTLSYIKLDASILTLLTDHIRNSSISRLADEFQLMVFEYFLICFLTIGLISAVTSYFNRRTRIQTLEMKEALAKEQVILLKDSITEVRQIRHNLKHHLTAMQMLLEAGNTKRLKNYLDILISEEEAIAPLYLSENLFVNNLLQQKFASAQKQQITITHDIHIPKTLPIQDTDLCNFLMNMMDNATEACLQFPSPKQRTISLEMRIANNMLKIRCTNPFHEKIRRGPDGTLLSRKSGHHGYGIYTMQQIAEKYHGALLTEERDGFFTVSAVFSLESESGKAPD